MLSDFFFRKSIDPGVRFFRRKMIFGRHVRRFDRAHFVRRISSLPTKCSDKLVENVSLSWVQLTDNPKVRLHVAGYKHCGLRVFHRQNFLSGIAGVVPVASYQILVKWLLLQVGILKGRGLACEGDTREKTAAENDEVDGSRQLH